MKPKKADEKKYTDLLTKFCQEFDRQNCTANALCIFMRLAHESYGNQWKPDFIVPMHEICRISEPRDVLMDLDDLQDRRLITYEEHVDYHDIPYYTFILNH